MTVHKADASPPKEFFVNMITKDITIEDAILDLLDNSLDGARKVLYQKNGQKPVIDDYNGFEAHLHLDSNNFSIEDNCGGISISDAIDYAFHFGRRPDAPDGEYAIGVYGIGMKRAMFKMGRAIHIHSSNEKEAFTCDIDVDQWLAEPNNWEIELEDAALIKESGTIIKVSRLLDSVSEIYSDMTFINELTRIVARDYAVFLDKGFRIFINGEKVHGYKYAVKESDDFEPHRYSYEDEGVQVEILAGMTASPPDEIDPTEHGFVRTGAEYYGWFVLCNDRVVLAANKNGRTVWGNGGFPIWHPQFNGFTGMAIFHSTNPNALPWTTTKRDVDESSPIYRRAVAQMKRATKPWIEYTNQRKSDIDEAKRREASAKAISLFSVNRDSEFKLPKSPGRPKLATISYKRERDEVRNVAKALGNENMSYKNVGSKTFDYFVENELED
ncbi:ATP-binding protein [Ferruginivarius sediminum]|uniref:ATP-binding protein n=1 Tax=Ferruginivarius sediminum TaxID=2661937 RepID=A0A369T4P2_9PROT|nr:ATP-binding protein [Ferruginivarius sediminum]RDD60208.1 ATP-binding protein [Ferruginivarius sediminum]